MGSVGTGWTGREATELRRKLAALKQQACPSAAAREKLDAGRGAVGSEHWIKPVTVAEVEFAEITPDGQVRHPSFVGLRARVRQLNAQVSDFIEGGLKTLPYNSASC